MPTLLHPRDKVELIKKLEHDRLILFHLYDNNPRTQAQIDAMSRELFELKGAR